MQILKTFIDSTGHRHKVGAPVPKEWDKATLAHYQHHGMVGDAQSTAKPQTNPRKPAGPAEKKPAAPRETKAAAEAEAAAAAAESAAAAAAEVAAAESAARKAAE